MPSDQSDIILALDSLVPSESQQEALNLQWAEQPHEYSFHPANLFCSRSGILLGQFIPSIVEARETYVQSFHDTILIHPAYTYNQTKLAQRLHAALYSAHELEWDIQEPHKQRIQLLCSAIMWNLGSIRQERPGLPSFPIAAGSAARILALAKWYWFISSQRLVFPAYSVSSRHGNLEWQNIRRWLDACFEIKQAWETKSRKAAQRQELLDATESTQLVIRKQLYKRLDLNKIWNWIKLQCDGEYAPGQLTTWKDLFLNGDMEAHYWTADDVDDLSDAIVNCCDIGNEITSFISDRLACIRACIKDYGEGYTIIDRGHSSSLGLADGSTPQEVALFAELDKQADAIEALPAKPEQKDYPSKALFWQAEAKWNLLAKRFKGKPGNETEL
jgi:hypothetical protein